MSEQPRDARILEGLDLSAPAGRAPCAAGAIGDALPGGRRATEFPWQGATAPLRHGAGADRAQTPLHRCAQSPGWRGGAGRGLCASRGRSRPPGASSVLRPPDVRQASCGSSPCGPSAAPPLTLAGKDKAGPKPVPCPTPWMRDPGCAGRRRGTVTADRARFAVDSPAHARGWNNHRMSRTRREAAARAAPSLLQAVPRCSRSRGGRVGGFHGDWRWRREVRFQRCVSRWSPSAGHRQPLHSLLAQTWTEGPHFQASGTSLPVRARRGSVPGGLATRAEALSPAPAARLVLTGPLTISWPQTSQCRASADLPSRTGTDGFDL